MSCQRDLEELDALVTGEMPAERARELEAHAQTCGRCAAELDWLRRERGLFAARAERQGRPPVELWLAVERRLQQGRLRGWLSRRRNMFYGLVTVGALAAAGTVFLVQARRFHAGPTVAAARDAGAAIVAPAATALTDNKLRAERALAKADRTQEEQVASLEASVQARRAHLNERAAKRYDARYAQLVSLRQSIDRARLSAGSNVDGRRRVVLATSRYAEALQDVLLEEVPQ